MLSMGTPGIAWSIQMVPVFYSDTVSIAPLHILCTEWHCSLSNMLQMDKLLSVVNSLSCFKTHLAIISLVQQ